MEETGKIKCVTDINYNNIIPIDKIVLIEPEFKRVYIHKNENSIRWYTLSDEQFNALMRELDFLGDTNTLKKKIRETIDKFRKNK